MPMLPESPRGGRMGVLNFGVIWLTKRRGAESAEDM